MLSISATTSLTISSVPGLPVGIMQHLARLEDMRDINTLANNRRPQAI